MAAPSSAPTSDWRLSRLAARLLVAVFAVAVATPGLATLAGVGLTAQRDEPAAAGADASPLMAVADRFDRQFAFRTWMVGAQARAREAVFRVSPLPTVWRGREGWWFYADDGAVEATLNETPFTAEDLDVWRRTLQHTADWLAARGITYLFVVAPDKASIHPEGLPRGLHPGPGPTRTDQLVAHLAAHATVPVIDLRADLLAASARERVFHRTDSHWDDVGAAVAYRRVVAALGRRLPSMGLPAGDDAFTRAVVDTPGGDLASMMGLTATVREQEQRLVPRVPRRARVVEPATDARGFGVPRVVTTVDDTALPRAVVYRDSSGSALIPFLAEHFRRMTVIWEYDVVPQTVRDEQPDVVIHEWTGRRLYTRLPYDFVAGDPAALDDLRRIGPAGR